MTTGEVNNLERAMHRATKNGVHITGHGTIKRTGQHFYTVLGAHGHYVVLVSRTHLTCNCPAQGLCTHRAVVHTHLCQQAETQRIVRETCERELAEERASAPLRRSNAPLSIFK